MQQQLKELPRLAGRVVEHEFQRACCRDCRRERDGDVPADVSRGGFGPGFSPLAGCSRDACVRNLVSRPHTVESRRRRVSTGSRPTISMSDVADADAASLGQPAWREPKKQFTPSGPDQVEMTPRALRPPIPNGVETSIRAYAARAADYDRLHVEIFNDHEQARLAQSLARAKELVESDGKRGLDYGCGSGNLNEVRRHVAGCHVETEVQHVPTDSSDPGRSPRREPVK